MNMSGMAQTDSHEWSKHINKNTDYQPKTNPDDSVVCRFFLRVCHTNLPLRLFIVAEVCRLLFAVSISRIIGISQN